MLLHKTYVIPKTDQFRDFANREGHEFTRAAVGLDIAALAAEVCCEAYAPDVPGGHIFRDLRHLAAQKAFRCGALCQTIPENSV
jgi:hypothetical protein